MRKPRYGVATKTEMVPETRDARYLFAVPSFRIQAETRAITQWESAHPHTSATEIINVLENTVRELNAGKMTEAEAIAEWTTRRMTNATKGDQLNVQP